jgi:hypothetical protein
MGGAIVMALVILLMAGITVYLVGALARSIGHEKRTQMGLWKKLRSEHGLLRSVSPELDRAGSGPVAGVHR